MLRKLAQKLLEQELWGPLKIDGWYPHLMWNRVGLWLNDDAMFCKTLIERNNKEIIAHLRDKHSECCIFNIVQHHQTFVNKD